MFQRWGSGLSMLVALAGALSLGCETKQARPAAVVRKDGAAPAQAGATGTAGAGGASADDAATTTTGAPLDDAGAPTADAEEPAAPDAGPEPDAPPGCPNVCTVGSARCANDRVEVCAMVNGCPAYQPGMACQAPQVCTMTGPTTASCGCPKVCDPGKKSCVNKQLAECVRMTPDGCPTVKQSACPAPQTCTEAGGTAACTCPRTCTVGQKRCQPAGPGGTLQECKVNVMGGVCPDFQDVQSCGAQICTMMGNNAACTCPPPGGENCKDGEQRCGAGGVRQTCKTMGNACPQFVNDPCPNNDVCTPGNQRAGTRTATCGCPPGSCTAGEKRCRGNNLETCVVQNGCGTFGMGMACMASTCAEANQGGKQAASCCPVAGDDTSCAAGEKRCVGVKLQSCVAAGGICGKFADDNSCGAGTFCKADATMPPNRKAQCVSCPPPCMENALECSMDGKLLLQCRRNQMTGCLELETQQTCPTACRAAGATPGCE